MKFLKIYKKIKIDEDRKFFFETRHQIVNTMLREEMKKNRICIFGMAISISLVSLGEKQLNCTQVILDPREPGVQPHPLLKSDPR